MPWAGVVPPKEPDLSQLRLIFNRYRAESGLTYEALAERSGVSRQTLLNIASGKYHGDLRTWILLSQAFGVDLGTLMSGTLEGRDR